METKPTFRQLATSADRASVPARPLPAAGIEIGKVAWKIILHILFFQGPPVFLILSFIFVLEFEPLDPFMILPALLFLATFLFTYYLAPFAFRRGPLIKVSRQGLAFPTLGVDRPIPWSEIETGKEPAPLLFLNFRMDGVADWLGSDRTGGHLLRRFRRATMPSDRGADHRVLWVPSIGTEPMLAITTLIRDAKAASSERDSRR